MSVTSQLQPHLLTITEYCEVSSSLRNSKKLNKPGLMRTEELKLLKILTSVSRSNVIVSKDTDSSETAKPFVNADFGNLSEAKKRRIHLTILLFF